MQIVSTVDGVVQAGERGVERTGVAGRGRGGGGTAAADGASDASGPARLVYLLGAAGARQGAAARPAPRRRQLAPSGDVRRPPARERRARLVAVQRAEEQDQHCAAEFVYSNGGLNRAFREFQVLNILTLN